MLNVQRITGLAALIAAVTLTACAPLLDRWLPAALLNAWLRSTGVSLVVGVLCGTGVWLLLEAAAQTRRALESYLLQLEDSQLAGRSHIEPPTLPTGDPFAPSFARIHQSLCQMFHRLNDLEHAHSATEVRVRRSRQQHDRIIRMVNAIQEPVLAVDAYDQIVVANGSAERLLQLPAADVGRRAVDEIERCQALVSLLQETRRRGTGSVRREQLLLADDEGGEERCYEATVTGLGSEAEATTQGLAEAVVVLHDVTAQRQAQTRHAEFVSSVSHEMKTPLACIRAYVELLEDGDAEDEQTQLSFLQVINTQAERLQRLIDNLLNLARIEAGVARVTKQPLDLNELLREALRVMSPMAEQKQITLHADLSQLYLAITADRDMLLQAAINLLSNAIKYTHEGGSVTLRSRHEDNHVAFEVEDTGVGLDEADRARVFEKFYRVHKDSGMASGTGLGLSLVKQIVEDVHGGELSLRSQPGVGSVFRVSLFATQQHST